MLPIRRVSPTESALLAEFGGRLFWEAYQDIGDRVKLLSFIQEHYTAERFSEILSHPQTQAYLWEEECWKGYVMMEHGATFAEANTQALTKVNLLYLDRRWQGQGIGRQLLQHAEDKARDAGSEMLWLTVWPITPALAFYLKMGLHKIGEIPF
ncbi:MAG: GNAT family N-acetyltransferase, partial [Bacteroidia bacterium]|nr:GNAT family N-acetyltransferase [Bacteroidia bacterium]